MDQAAKDLVIMRAACDHLTRNLTMRSITKLSTKGQIVLPKALRTAHRWNPGTEFIIQEHDEGVLLKPQAARATRSWESLIGCVPYTGPRKSVKEMDQAVAAEAKSRK